MRIKTLLGAAIVAASVATAAAQNVYSLNVVGYVTNIYPANGYSMVISPLDNTNADLNTIFPNPPNATTLLTWNVANQTFDTAIPRYLTSTHLWSPDPTLAPGVGVFFHPAGKPYTNIYVGNVRQGALYTGGTTNTIVQNGYVMVGCPIPVAGDLNSPVANGTNVLGGNTSIAGYAPRNADTLLTWNVANQSFNTAIPRYLTSTHVWNPNYNFQVGEAMFFHRAGGGNTNWVYSYSVQ